MAVHESPKACKASAQNSTLEVSDSIQMKDSNSFQLDLEISTEELPKLCHDLRNASRTLRYVMEETREEDAFLGDLRAQKLESLGDVIEFLLPHLNDLEKLYSALKKG